MMDVTVTEFGLNIGELCMCPVFNGISKYIVGGESSSGEENLLLESFRLFDWFDVGIKRRIFINGMNLGRVEEISFDVELKLEYTVSHVCLVV